MVTFIVVFSPKQTIFLPLKTAIRSQIASGNSISAMLIVSSLNAIETSLKLPDSKLSIIIVPS